MIIKQIDNFFENQISERGTAAQCSFQPIKCDETYFHGISPSDDPMSFQKIEAVIGKKFKSKICFFRRYSPADPQPTYIHDDVYIGEYTAIAFLNSQYSDGDGLAFWENKELKTDHIPDYSKLSKEDAARITMDGLDESKWKMKGFVPMNLGGAIVFDSRLFHSRYPKNKSGEDRLVKVFFLR